MDQMLITVVLPVYKVEKFLDRCIESVVGQTYRNLEILLIDDGSPDRCPSMCDEWALKDSRIRVIHKKNAGLGEARNTGIENASGSYICFFDSDDYIHPETIEKCVTRLNRDHADVVIFGVNCVNSTGRITASYPPSVGEITFCGKDVEEKFLLELIAPTVQKDGSRSFYMSAWVMLYSMEKIRSIQWRFVSERDIISEDVYSLLSLFRFVQVVSVIPEAFYFYCENNASLSRRYIKDRYKRIKDFYLKSQELCEKIDGLICFGYNLQFAGPNIDPLAF